MDNKKEKLEWKDLYRDSKYRARIILLGYLLLFVILIAAVGGGVPFEKYQKDQEPALESEKSPSVEGQLESFDLIRSANFQFQYLFESNGQSYQIEGKKYQEKEIFTLSYAEEMISFVVSENGIFARIGEESYQSASRPYQYINYFDVSLLEKILYQSSKLDDTHYEISNTILSKILGNEEELEGSAMIEVILQNNYITGIKMDYSSYANSKDSSIMSMSFVLNYSNFNLIDDFEINFA